MKCLENVLRDDHKILHTYEGNHKSAERDKPATSHIIHPTFNPQSPTFDVDVNIDAVTSHTGYDCQWLLPFGSYRGSKNGHKQMPLATAMMLSTLRAKLSFHILKQRSLAFVAVESLVTSINGVHFAFVSGGISGYFCRI